MTPRRRIRAWLIEAEDGGCSVQPNHRALWAAAVRRRPTGAQTARGGRWIVSAEAGGAGRPGRPTTSSRRATRLRQGLTWILAAHARWDRRTRSVPRSTSTSSNRDTDGARFLTGEETRVTCDLPPGERHQGRRAVRHHERDVHGSRLASSAAGARCGRSRPPPVIPRVSSADRTAHSLLLADIALLNVTGDELWRLVGQRRAIGERRRHGGSGFATATGSEGGRHQSLSPRLSGGTDLGDRLGLLRLPDCPAGISDPESLRERHDYPGGRAPSPDQAGHSGAKPGLGGVSFRGKSPRGSPRPAAGRRWARACGGRQPGATPPSHAAGLALIPRQPVGRQAGQELQALVSAPAPEFLVRAGKAMFAGPGCRAGLSSSSTAPRAEPRRRPRRFIDQRSERFAGRGLMLVQNCLRQHRRPRPRMSRSGARRARSPTAPTPPGASPQVRRLHPLGGAA